MPIQNSFKFTKTLFEDDVFLKATKNIFQFVSQKPYKSKKNPSDKGVIVTLLVIYDTMDYGEDKNGIKRESNVLNTFDVTILNGGTVLPFKKGDKVSLEGYIPEKSYVIGFDLLLRFKGLKKAGE